VAGKPEAESGGSASGGGGSGAGLRLLLCGMKSLFLVLIGVAMYACSQPQPTAAAETPDPRFPECPTCSELEKPYYFADTSFTRHDSLFIVNNRLDTTVIETGIFTYTKYGYPIETPDELVLAIKQAIRAEESGNYGQAITKYHSAVSYYQNTWLKRKEGFENGGFSDLNDYYSFNVNVAVLVSYAFEKLGRLPEARAALSPFLANVEAEQSKIQLRYVQLCIRQYGKAATKQALDACGKTVHRSPSEDSPEGDRWRVVVFGATLGVADFNTDTLSQQQAQAIVHQQPYYTLVK
jgi:hypothetical protein